MSESRGKSRDEFERGGADPKVDDREGAQPEDSWSGGERYGWFDALLRRFGKPT